MDATSDNFGLSGKVALVSGGTRGIGRATVEAFAKAGVRVIFNYRRDEEAARDLQASLEGTGFKILPSKADVTRTDQVEQLVALALEKFGGIDFLVCNAGVWRGAPLEEMDERLWEQTMDVNLKGTWTLCRASVPLLKRASSGRIVIVSSTAGQRGEAFYSNYAASKGGQIAFMKSLAAELAPYDINVNAVAPGWVETEMTEGVFADEARRKQIEQSIPLGRVAQPVDVAQPILFLCSSWSRHITGEVLSINGGSVLCG
jgi:3-oxoacyl-[acyl-carrier protein] reductase